MPAGFRDQCYNCVSVTTAPQLERARSLAITPVIVALIALAALLRFWHLGAKSLWLDETITAWLAQAPSHVFTHALWRGGEGNMSLYYVIMRAWVQLGSTEWMLRSLSVLMGIAVIPIFFILGKHLFGSRVGLIAALLLTINACHVAYSQEARSYTLFFLLAILSSYLFVRAIESGRSRDYIAYAVISALAVYSHFFALLLVAAQGTSLLALPRERVRWLNLLLAAIVLAVLAGPALFFIVGRDTGQLAWVAKSSLREVQRFGYFLVADQGTLRQPLLAAYLVLAALAIMLFVKRRSDQGDTLARWKLILVVCWFIVPPALAVVASIWKPVFVARFLIFCLAPLLLLSAAELAAIRTAWLRHTLTLALAATSFVPTFWYYRQPKEQWREAIDHIATHSQPRDVVILNGAYPGAPFGFYAKRMRWPADITTLTVMESGDADRVRNLVAPRAWVLMHGLPSDPAAQQVQRDLATRYQETGEERYFMVTVLLYSRPISQQNR